MLHEDLTGDNIVFNDDGLIQICDFCQNGLSEVGGNSEGLAEVGGFSGEGWRPTADVRTFAELLSRIVIDKSAEEHGCALSLPAFVLNIIENGQSFNSNAKLSFVEPFETLENNDFQILEGVDSTEVSNFVSWIEFSEGWTE
jgi:hypothetical protein